MWVEGSDRETPTEALSYNIRVGTFLGGNDVVSSLSNAETGARYIAARGNAENNLNWSIRGLAPGTYFWSVQTIDTSYIGSAFSPEGTFTVTP